MAKRKTLWRGLSALFAVAAELICQKIDGLICHGQPN